MRPDIKRYLKIRRCDCGLRPSCGRSVTIRDVSRARSCLETRAEVCDDVSARRRCRARRQRRAPSRRRSRGLVQGVGFRPFVYALARELGLSGRVGNTAAGVVVEVEGDAGRRRRSSLRRARHRRAAAGPGRLRRRPKTSRRVGGTDFVIAASQRRRGPHARLARRRHVRRLPGRAGRPGTTARHRHAFISCTNCGPRFTVVATCPTTARPRRWPTCRCARGARPQYADPADRRFHAQTVACPDCGPTLTLRAGADELDGRCRRRRTRAACSRRGAIVAVKGIGGYHLACDADRTPTRSPRCASARTAATSRSP